MKIYLIWLPQPSNIKIWRGLGTVSGESGGVLGNLAASWDRFERALGASWHVQGRLGGDARRLGVILGHLGKILEGFWRVLEAF